MPQAAPTFSQKQKEADQPGQLLFTLGSLARCGHAVVQHGLQGLPVLQGAAGRVSGSRPAFVMRSVMLSLSLSRLSASGSIMVQASAKFS